MKRIYVITNRVNGKQYIGQTSYSLSHRFSQHCNNMSLQTLIHSAILEFGKNNFDISEICECEDCDADRLEQFYIEAYHTHHTEGGYNLGRGGKINPMFDAEVKLRHKTAVSTDERRELSRNLITQYNNSPLRKLHDKETSLRQKGIYSDNLKNYNTSKKKPVGMIVDGKVVKKFDSASEACKYFGKPSTNAGKLLKMCDKVNKYGKPAKFYGYSWTILEG